MWTSETSGGLLDKDKTLQRTVLDLGHRCIRQTSDPATVSTSTETVCTTSNPCRFIHTQIHRCTFRPGRIVHTSDHQLQTGR